MNETLLLDLNNLNFTKIHDDFEESSSTSIWTAKFVISVVLFGIVALLAVAGNTVIIWTVCARKPMKSAANYLIVSIAIADILMAVLYTPLLSLSLMKRISWPFGNYSCKLFEMVPSTIHSITKISLMAISIVWFKIIVCPSQIPLTKREGVKIAIAIWAVSFFVAIPKWMYARIETYGSDVYCVTYWSRQFSYAEAFYLIFFTTWTYFFPAIWFICTYIIISDKLFRTYSLVGRWHDDVDGLKHNKQSVKMMIVVTVIQLICLCPLIVIQICAKFADLHFSEIVVTIADLVAFTTAMWKPIIYLAISNKFRSNMKETFSWFSCITSDDY